MLLLVPLAGTVVVGAGIVVEGFPTEAAYMDSLTMVVVVGVGGVGGGLETVVDVEVVVVEEVVVRVSLAPLSALS